MGGTCSTHQEINSTLVNMVMNFRLSQIARNFLTRSAKLSASQGELWFMEFSAIV
jgi:hypothetical protein